MPAWPWSSCVHLKPLIDSTLLFAKSSISLSVNSVGFFPIYTATGLIQTLTLFTHEEGDSSREWCRPEPKELPQIALWRISLQWSAQQAQGDQRLQAQISFVNIPGYFSFSSLRIFRVTFLTKFTLIFPLVQTAISSSSAAFLAKTKLNPWLLKNIFHCHCTATDLLTNIN